MSGSSTLLLAVVLIAANVLGAAMAVPQAVKLRRTRLIEGVSAAWVGISITVNAWWAIYGIGVGDLGIVPVSAVSVTAYLAIALFLVRFSPIDVRPLPTMIGAAVAVAAVPATVLAVGGWTACGIAIGALYGVQLTPAVVSVYRSVDVSGVSGATWVIAWLEAALWGVYGGVRLDAGLVALAVTGVFMSTLVLARLLLRRPRRDRRPAPGTGVALGANGLLPA